MSVIYIFDAVRRQSKVSILLVFAMCTVSVGSCGFLTPGRTGINDPVPQGVIVAQGTFTGLNGNTVSGTAAIYVTSSAQYIARIEALRAPSQNGMIVEVVADGSVAYSSSLTGISGNQNYPIGSANVTNWNYISILSSTTPQPSNEVGRATLIKVNLGSGS